MQITASALQGVIKNLKIMEDFKVGKKRWALIISIVRPRDGFFKGLNSMILRQARALVLVGAKNMIFWGF